MVPAIHTVYVIRKQLFNTSGWGSGNLVRELKKNPTPLEHVKQMSSYLYTQTQLFFMITAFL